MINCGHCRGLHKTIAEVKRCSTSETLAPSAFRSVEWNGLDIEAIERDMQRMEAEGDRAEARRDTAAKVAKWDAESRAWTLRAENDDPADLRALMARVDGMLVTRDIPEGDHRWSRAVRALISGQGNVTITEYALRTAIARLEGYPLISGATAAPIPAQRKPLRAEGKAVEREGLYRLSRSVRLEGEEHPNGTLFQVVRGKDSMKLYAKRVEGLEGLQPGQRPVLTYVRGMVFNLLDSELVPVEEAQEITRKTGWCVFGHYLTNPKSIARGMGPKCFERYPHLALNAEVAA